MTHNTNRSRAWFIWTIAVIYYLYEYIHRIAPSVMVSDLMRSFQVNAATLGNLSAIYFYIYAIFQVSCRDACRSLWTQTSFINGLHYLQPRGIVFLYGAPSLLGTN